MVNDRNQESIYLCYAIILPYNLSLYFLFITSTYRDLAGFFAPLAAEATRLDNNASKGSTFWAGGGNAVDIGLEGGSFGPASFVTDAAKPDGVGAGGCIVVS